MPQPKMVTVDQLQLNTLMFRSENIQLVTSQVVNSKGPRRLSFFFFAVAMYSHKNRLGEKGLLRLTIPRDRSLQSGKTLWQE